MNSSLYRQHVWHQRVFPKPHSFNYRYFSFMMDLDDIEDSTTSLFKKIKFLGHNKFNLFDFRESDHLFFKKDKTLKDTIKDYLSEKITWNDEYKIYLLTHFRFLGYVFNPVSFYFVRHHQKCVAVLAEVNNTFHEMKPFLLLENENGLFVKTEKKYFYVSPFENLDSDFHFSVKCPQSIDDEIDISIDVYRNNVCVFKSRLVGSSRPLTTLSLLSHAMRFPFVTLKIIFSIHWQAFRLFLKGLKYHRKNENAQWQREVYHVPGR